METLTANGVPDWLGPKVAGRRIRLTHASKRVERLKKMSEFFSSEGVTPETVERLRAATDELLVNAFYSAPVAAGAVTNPILESQDVSLPSDCACDMVYGFRGDFAIVRVRNPFGSLSRRRLVDVLTRCSRMSQEALDDQAMETGLGLWRVFAGVSFVAVSVIENRQTEVLIGVQKRAASGPRPFAFHLLFKEGARRRFWQTFDEDTGESIADPVGDRDARVDGSQPRVR